MSINNKKGKDYIKTLNIGVSSIKKLLNNINDVLDDLKKYNIDFNYDIVIDNVSNMYKNTLFDAVYNLLNIHEYNVLKARAKILFTTKEIDENKRKCFHLTEENIDFFENHYISINNKKEDIIKIYTISSNNSSYEELLGENYDKNKYLFFRLNLIDKKDSIKNLVNKYKNNNVNLKITTFDIKNIYKHCLKYNLCDENSFADYIYSLSIKWMLENGKKEIDNMFLHYFFLDRVNINNDITLDNFIGLNNIKEEINSLKKYCTYCKNNNININKKYLNMFFLGNPGTGKTTSARIVASELYKLGLVKEDKFISVVPNDLVGKYVGHTRDTTRKILESAQGGVLFIDEAYNLISASNERSGQFMSEAVEELLKYLENPENVVIFSGYEEEMKKIYGINPGIKSRIYKEIYFDNFSISELYEIIIENLKQYNLKISTSSKRKILEILNVVIKDNTFGNARFCEKFAESIFINHINNEDSSDIISISDINLGEYEIIGKMGW
ncbi:MAG: AAA family ATPase [Firmicutes bacterium]|nr:AAA family ATPase [Bacillota bacterium]